MNRRSLLALAAAASLTLLAHPVFAAGKMKVVASFSILGDIVHQVGGDRIEVTTFVGPNGDAHVYQPTPADAKALVEAKILFLNGLGLEGWMARLQQSTAFKGTVVTASKGVKSQQMEEEEDGKTKVITDPHAWQNLANGKLYAQNIRDALIKADPDGTSVYEANAAKFIAAIDELEPQVKAQIETIPVAKRKIITSHDAFGYFGKAYGFEFLAPQGVSTESEASAKDVAKIIKQIKAEKIPALFMENISDPRLLEQISRESGAKIGGSLFSDSLSPSDGPAATYLDMFRSNVKTLVAALTSPS
jgi:zinc/manganese transport system substrate-binding protein